MLITIAKCDRCGKEIVLASACGVCVARKFARKEGWSVSRKKGELLDTTYCTECRKQRKRQVTEAEAEK